MTRFTRRTLILGSVAAALPIRAWGQATPEAIPAVPYADLKGFQGGDFRRFAIADPGLADVFGGSIIIVDCVAIQFDRPQQARVAIDEASRLIEDYYRAVVRADPDFAGSTFRAREVSAPELGDANLARSLIVNRDGEASWSYGISTIAKETIIQVIAGQSAFGALSPTLDIAEGMIDRWDGDNIADALPTLSDMPDGMAEVSS